MEEIQSSAAQTERARPADSEHLSLARAFGGPSLLREIVETVLLAMILFAVVNLTTARFRVHGSSMEPTLQEGEYLIVSKVVYQVHPPERGDIIVFRPPSGSEDYIKRIIGLPGDRVEIRDGTVLVNGVALEESYTLSPAPYSGTWTLGTGQYFVLGDNRANSSDSHSWGVLPYENIIGKAWLCYWPPEKWGPVAHHRFAEVNEGED